jgi:23S rRNA pseudouridine2605 synthase
MKDHPKKFTRKREKPRSSNSTKKNQDAIRLNRFISMAGICSRREADDLIRAGVVEVNGKVITEMGFQVKPTDEVKYGGETIRPEKKVYLLLNKPKDYITTTSDPLNRKTVMNLVKRACKEAIFPVGRLDRNTTGLLLLTNDGDLAKRLMHPSSNIKKLYRVQLHKKVDPLDLKKLKDGIALEDGFMKVDEATFVGDQEDRKQVGVELHSGKNRIIRRLFEHLNYRVVKLDRVMFAGLTKKEIPRGKYRFLTEKEVSFLKMST